MGTKSVRLYLIYSGDARGERRDILPPPHPKEIFPQTISDTKKKALCHTLINTDDFLSTGIFTPPCESPLFRFLSLFFDGWCHH